MALSKEHIDEIVELYDGGKGDSITDLARTYGVTKLGITYHLQKRGVYAAVTAKSEKPVSDVEDLVGEDDAALGIGEADGDDMDALMVNPKFAQAVEAVVDARMKAAGAAPREPRTDAAAFEAFLDTFSNRFDHMIEVQAEQRPGYIKPLSADEVDGRRKGRVDMFALLRDYKTRNVWPHYLLGDESNPFYGPSPNGDILYEAGQEIYTRLPPAEGFKPLNEEAVAVYEAYRRWVGDAIPIADLIAQAAADARGGAPSPEIAEVNMRTPDAEVRLVDKPARDVGAKRVLGNLTPEKRGVGMPKQTGVVAQPAGPTFVHEGV